MKHRVDHRLEVRFLGAVNHRRRSLPSWLAALRSWSLRSAVPQRLRGCGLDLHLAWGLVLRALRRLLIF